MDNSKKPDNTDNKSVVSEQDGCGIQETGSIYGKESYEKIFKDGYVNVRKLNDESDSENFKNIDQAVDYIQLNDKKLRLRCLYKVKATIVKYKNDLKVWSPNFSLIAFVTVIFSLVSFIYKSAINIDKENEGIFTSMVGFIILLVIVVGIYTAVCVEVVDNSNLNLMYLTYLEKQLESDIEDNNEENNDEENKSEEINKEESDK